jgi:hypothetical protein
MSFGRILMLGALVAIVLWVCANSVMVGTSGKQVNITIDTQKLKQAGRDAVQQGRQAVAKAGQYLERTGKKLEEVRPDEASPPQPPARPRLMLPWSQPHNAPTG